MTGTLHPGWLPTILILAGFTAAASDPEPRVYHGRIQDCRNPSEIRATRVFEQIPEYQRIQREGLTRDDPQYWILLDRANQKFYRAVGSAARSRSRDCIVETGTHELGSIPDDTQAVIDALE